MVGTVKGHEIGLNNDGDKLVVKLQVEITDPLDIQTIELFTHAGVDYIPPVESRVKIAEIEPGWKIALASQDLIDPIAVAGDYEIYSQDGGAKKARVKLNKGGLILFSNDAEDLKTLMNDMITEIKAIETFGSPTNHAVDPATQALFDTLNGRFNALLGAP